MHPAFTYQVNRSGKAVSPVGMCVCVSDSLNNNRWSRWL